MTGPYPPQHGQGGNDGDGWKGDVNSPFGVPDPNSPFPPDGAKAARDEDESSPYEGVQYSLETPGYPPTQPPPMGPPPTGPVTGPLSGPPMSGPPRPPMGPPPGYPAPGYPAPTPGGGGSGWIIGGIVAGVVLLLVVAGVIIVVANNSGGDDPTPGPTTETSTVADGEYTYLAEELCEQIDLGPYAEMDSSITNLSGDSYEGTRQTDCATSSDHGSLNIFASWYDDEAAAANAYESAAEIWLSSGVEDVRDVDGPWTHGRLGEDEQYDETYCGATLVVSDKNMVITIRFWLIGAPDADQAKTLDAVHATAEQALELSRNA